MFGQEQKQHMVSIPERCGKIHIFKYVEHFYVDEIQVLDYSQPYYTNLSNYRFEVKVLDELETKVEPAIHELRLGWSSDDTDMQLGINIEYYKKYPYDSTIVLKSVNRSKSSYLI